MNTPAAQPLLAIRDLRVTYRIKRRPVEAVRGVSFTLPRGRCLGIAGESGCGKSTLARAILALEPAATTGEIRFDGANPLAMTPRQTAAFRRRAQIIFQDTLGSLNPRLTVGAALQEVLRFHHIAADAADARARTLQWLETVGLTADFARRYPHEMSGGQRQRVNIARALCVGAELLIADEPASALDVGVQAQILNLLKRLQREHGITCILIGHDLAALQYMADDLLVMRHGETMGYGPAAALLSAPPHPYIQELLNAVPVLPG